MNDRVFTNLQGPAAPPRQNGELVFTAPWQGRALGIAVALVRKLDLDWGDFRQRLIAAIAAHPDRPYYESWAAALEAFAVDNGFADANELQRRAAGTSATR